MSTRCDPMLSQEILSLLELALREDVRSGDITSEACVSPDEEISGRLMLKESGRVAGLTFLAPLFQLVDSRVQVKLHVHEGADLPAGTELASIRGPARALFTAELTALNVLQHCSGIATITAEFVERVEGYHCDILDTRKTLPGLRILEKYAVKVGGGKNHRYGLDDRFIIKQSHLRLLQRDYKQPILEAVRRAREYRPEIKVEVETEDLAQVKEAIEAKADVILLQSMSIPMVYKAVRLVGGKSYVEATGGVLLETVQHYAETGVNGISIGALTHSVRALDMSLRF